MVVQHLHLVARFLEGCKDVHAGEIANAVNGAFRELFIVAAVAAGVRARLDRKWDRASSWERQLDPWVNSLLVEWMDRMRVPVCAVRWLRFRMAACTNATLIRSPHVLALALALVAQDATTGTIYKNQNTRFPLGGTRPFVPTGDGAPRPV